MRSSSLVLVIVTIALLFGSPVFAQRGGNGHRGPRGPRPGHRPPPLLFSRGLATDASVEATETETETETEECSELEKKARYGLVVVPAPPEGNEDNDGAEVSEDDEQERPELEELELIGHFAVNGQHLFLSNVEITTEEITPEGSDEAIKVIASLWATLNSPPSREEAQEARENGEEITLDEIGTIEITIAATEFEDEEGETRMRPELTGTASFTNEDGEDVELTLNGGIGLPPRRPRNHGRRNGQGNQCEGEGEMADSAARSVRHGF